MKIIHINPKLKTDGVGWKKQSKFKKKVSKPKRQSKSVQSCQNLAKEHRWFAMVTFTPKQTTTESISNDYQKFLLALLRRELRGKGIGFMLVREFGTARGENNSANRSHFHVILTSELTINLQNRLKIPFIKRCGLKNNQSGAFEYTSHKRGGDPEFGEYISKLEKYGIDIKNPPGHWDYKKLIRVYHSGFLNESSLVNNIHLLAS